MMDLTKIEKPFGRLDKETQMALRDHARNGGEVLQYGTNGWFDRADGHFYNHITYCAAPKLVVRALYLARCGTVTILRAGNAAFKITYNIIDGEIDCDSVRMEKVEGRMMKNRNEYPRHLDGDIYPHDCPDEPAYKAIDMVVLGLVAAIVIGLVHVVWVTVTTCTAVIGGL